MAEQTAEMVDRVINDPIQEAEWLPLSLAALKAGVSVQTLRRRIKDRAIQARQVDSPFGKAWEVLLKSPVDGGDNTPDQNKTGVVNDPIQPEVSDRGSTSSEVIEALRLIQHLQEGMVAKAEAAAMWQARAEMLSFQLQGAQENIKALEAPKATESTPEAQETVSVEKEEESLDSASWWRLWWRRVVAG